MEATARHRYARISPTKARPVADLIHGMRLPAALDTLRVNNRRAARLIEKVVKSAWANAIEQGGRLAEDDFFVEAARVDQGPTLKRGRPGDRGRWRPILKRSAHITVVLSDRGD
ncbi:MAG: 50S ribosomal protein L22 [Planctomycetota bacterium]